MRNTSAAHAIAATVKTTARIAIKPFVAVFFWVDASVEIVSFTENYT